MATSNTNYSRPKGKNMSERNSFSKTTSNNSMSQTGIIILRITHIQQVAKTLMMTEKTIGI